MASRELSPSTTAATPESAAPTLKVVTVQVSFRTVQGHGSTAVFKGSIGGRADPVAALAEAIAELAWIAVRSGHERAATEAFAEAAIHARAPVSSGSTSAPLGNSGRTA